MRKGGDEIGPELFQLSKDMGVAKELATIISIDSIMELFQSVQGAIVHMVTQSLRQERICQKSTTQHPALYLWKALTQCIKGFRGDNISVIDKWMRGQLLAMIKGLKVWFSFINLFAYPRMNNYLC